MPSQTVQTAISLFFKGIDDNRLELSESEDNTIPTQPSGPLGVQNDENLRF
jgi:hypothetical protein